MLEGLIDGQKDAEQLADMAQRRMRSKIPELRLALQGNLREHHRLLLRSLMEHWKFLESQIAALDEEIEKSMVPFEGTVNLWQTIPGINKLTAWSLVAEMGVNMDQFPSAQHLASWAGLCPGNNESAGKRLSGRARHGNPWLKRVACQAAWAASHSKKTYCSAQYRRLVGRRGKKRAIIAVAHTLLVAGYSMLKNSCVYQDLGEKRRKLFRSDQSPQPPTLPCQPTPTTRFHRQVRGCWPGCVIEFSRESGISPFKKGLTHCCPR